MRGRRPRVFSVLAGVIAVVLLGATPANATIVPGDPNDPPEPDCVASTSGSLSVSPSTIVLGQSATVSWDTDQIAGCTVVKSLTGLGFAGNVAASGSRTVTPTAVGVTSWSLQASGATKITYNLGGASLTVQAPPSPLAVTTPLAAALDDSTGRLKVILARPGDDAIFRDEQAEPDGPFPGWTPVQGQLRSVAAAMDGSSRIMQVGFNANGNLYGAQQVSPGSTDWTNWTFIDGVVSSVALTANANGLLELFATTSNGSILHRTQTGYGAMSFGAWNTFPGHLTQIAAEKNLNGRIEVVGINSAGEIWHQTQLTVNGTGWSGWTQISGTLTSIAIAANAVGVLEIFGSQPDGQLRCRYQSAPNSSDWSGSFIVPDGHGGPVAAEDNHDGRIELFGRDAAGAIAERIESGTKTNDFGATWQQPLIQYAPTGTPTGSKHKVLVIPVSWAAGHGTPAAPPTRSLGEIMAMVNNKWWSEISYGQFAGWDVHGFGPITIVNTPHLDSDGSCGGDFEDDISEQGEYQAIHTGGLVPTDYETIIYWFTGIGPGCGWSGQWSSSGHIFINGGLENTMAHELGHSLGLSHAHAVSCVDRGVPVSYSNSCTANEYGDPNDTMASSSAGFDALERNRLGWMSGRIADVPSGGGSYTLSPLELTTPGLQALRLSDGTPLWLEYRQPVGSDGGRVGVPGVLIYAPYSGGLGTQFLDANPATVTQNDANIAAGTTWISPTGNFRVTVDSAVSTGAHITITLNRVTVPNVAGDDVATAQGKLAAAGLTQVVVHEVVDSTCTKVGKALGTAPAAGTQVNPASLLTLEAAVAPPAPAECA